jgi:preprotein translocase subunit SecA
VVVATNMAGRGTDIKLDPVLNEEIARNYAKRVKQQTDQGQTVKLNVFSEYEHDLVMKELEKLIH